MKKSIKRGLVTALTSAMAASGLLAVTSAAPAHADKLTNYGFNGWSYGTKVGVNPVGLQVGKTAYNLLGCTRIAGINKDVSVGHIEPPNEPQVIEVGAVTTNMRTYQFKNGRTGVRSSSKVAEVVIGNSELANITITGLETHADAYADKDGNLHAESSYESVDISANLAPVIQQFPQLEPILGPLQDLLNQVGATIGDLLEQIAGAVGNKIEIPGVAVLKLGVTWNKVRAQSADSAASALRVFIPGQDGQVNTDDDIQVTIGRGRSTITKDVPAGLMTGRAHAVDVTLLDDLATLGPIGSKRLHCEGTRGKINTWDFTGLNPAGLNLVDVGVGRSSVYGVQYASGYRRAWTQNELASLSLADGALEIDGIIARATAVKKANGKIKLTKKGSQVLGISANGTDYPVPVPGEILEIPGVALIESMVVEKGKRSITVTGLRVTLLDGTAAQSVVNLAVARVSLLNVTQ